MTASQTAYASGPCLPGLLMLPIGHPAARASHPQNGDFSPWEAIRASWPMFRNQNAQKGLYGRLTGLLGHRAGDQVR